MELAQLLRERRSVHSFEKRPVSPDLIVDLLDTAVWVPNYHLTQPWRFIITYGEGMMKIAEAVRCMKEQRESNPDKKKAVGDKFYNKVMAIPMIMTVLMKENPHLVVREEDYASTSCVIHNLSLLAWEQGIGMNWETYGWLHEPIFREAMGIMPGEKAVGNLHIGYPAKIPHAQTRIPAAELVTLYGEV